MTGLEPNVAHVELPLNVTPTTGEEVASESDNTTLKVPEIPQDVLPERKDVVEDVLDTATEVVVRCTEDIALEVPETVSERAKNELLAAEVSESGPTSSEGNVVSDEVAKRAVEEMQPKVEESATSALAGVQSTQYVANIAAEVVQPMLETKADPQGGQVTSDMEALVPNREPVPPASTLDGIQMPTGWTQVMNDISLGQGLCSPKASRSLGSAFDLWQCEPMPLDQAGFSCIQIISTTNITGEVPDNYFLL